MKLTLLTPALVAVLGFAVASTPMTVQAQSTNAAPAATTAPTPTSNTTGSSTKPHYTPYKGKISAEDASSVTVTTKSGDIKLAIDATTTFEVNKKKAAATDFAVGDAVTGSYVKNADGTFTAHSVHKKAATK